MLFCSDDLGFGFDKQLRNAITEVFAAEIAETLATNPGIKIEPVEPAPNSSDRPMLALTDAGNDCDEEIDNEDQVDTDNGDVSLEGELGFQMSLPPALRQFGGGGGGKTMTLEEMEDCSDDDVDKALKCCRNHELFNAYVEYCIKEVQVEEDWVFGDADGDPVQDILDFVDFLGPALSTQQLGRIPAANKTYRIHQQQKPSKHHQSHSQQKHLFQHQHQQR